jgi:hypothetical protein
MSAIAAKFIAEIEGAGPEEIAILALEYFSMAQSEGWKTRDAEVGTLYDVGWDEYDEESGEDVWHSNCVMNDYQAAFDKATRWGCDCRIMRVNPFE